jgi:hypothetical protein
MVMTRGVFCVLSWPTIVSIHADSDTGVDHTYGSPQYVHQQTCGLSKLMKILGWPSGPPPPSQATDFESTHRTGCL